MSEKPKQNKDPYFEVNSDLALDKITLEEFLRRRDTSEKQKYKDMKDFSRYYYLFSSLLIKLPIGIRLKACLYLHDLNIDDIKKMGLKKPDLYISEEFPRGKEKGVSFILIELAVILDLPFEFVTIQSPKLPKGNKTSFLEYNLSLNVKLLEFREILTQAFIVPNNRQIKGFICNDGNLLLPKILDESSIIRLDKRNDFFCIEIYTDSITNINTTWIENINTLLRKQVRYVYLSDALLRNCYKITFISTYSNREVELTNLVTFATEISQRERYTKIYPF